MTSLTAWDISFIVVAILTWLVMAYVVATFMEMVFGIASLGKWLLFVLFLIFPFVGIVALIVTLIYVICNPSIITPLPATPPSHGQIAEQ